MKTIESSLSKSGDVDPTAARAYAQECARRAAIRNPKYREQRGVEHSGEIKVDHYVAEIPAVSASTENWAQIVGGQVIEHEK